MHTLFRFTHSKRASLLVLVCIIWFSPQAAIPAAHGQSQGWSRPILLSSSDLSSWWPDITTDAAGHVHVAWAAAADNYDMVMYTSSPNGQEWSEPTDVVALPQGINGESAATRPAVLVDAQGTVHLSFVNTTIYYAQSPAATAQNARAWLPVQTISGVDASYFSRLAVDRNSKLHLIFTENVPSSECLICLRLFHRQSTDGGRTWSAPVDITDLPTGSAKPQILIDKQDNIHLVWESGRGGLLGHVVDPSKVMYTASRDGGRTWLAPIELGFPNRRARNISIASPSAGQLVVVWLGLPEDLVYYQVSRDLGQSWSAPQLVPAVRGGWTVYGTRLDDYTMASDSTGAAHLILIGRSTPDQETLSLFHLTWNGSAWSEPETIATITGDVPEWPRMAVDDSDGLHVVWFVRDQAHVWQQESSDYTIWYTHKPSGTPSRVALPWPTPTPMATRQAVATQAPIVAARPTADDRLPSLSIESLYTEADDLTSLATMLVPAIVLMAGVIAIVRLRRH